MSSPSDTLLIRDFDASDWPDVWGALQPTFADGESYPCPVDMAESDARRYWLGEPQRHVLVARDETDFLGTYYIRADQGGLGDHICNCGYVIAPAARGRGLAVRLALHSQEEARKLGFLGMKYNLVVATNEPAVRAWKKAGMEIIGVTPKAFRSVRHGIVDAYIMYKDLTNNSRA